MNSFDLINKIMYKYEKDTGRELSTEELGLYLSEIITVGSYRNRSFYMEELTKKNAARICYEFIKNVLALRDLDWGDATRFKDIYECRVCANPIAQVYNYGIIEPESVDTFGINQYVNDDNADMIVSKIMLLLK